MPQGNKRLKQYSTATQEQSSKYVPQPVVRAYEQTGEMVRSHPGSSALVTFGIGVGAGLLLTLLLGRPARRRQTWYEAHMPQWMSREGISRAMSRVLPS